MDDLRPSATASFIARSLLLLAAEPALRHLVDAASSRLSAAALAAAGVDVGRWRRWYASPAFRRLLWAAERRLLPGIVVHYALRKRVIDAEVAAGCAAGIRQVAVLAAGFDALGWRTACRRAAVRVVEIDHPATQAVKRRALAKQGTRLGWHAADLGRSSLAAALRAAGIDPDQPAMIVAEGFLMYLEEHRVATLLTEAAALAPGSRLIGTAMTASRGGRPDFPHAHPLIAHWLRRQREPFRWGMPAADLPAFLAATGWTCRRIIERDGLMRLAGCRRPSAPGEAVVVAERA